ncbi:MAG: T9SS type A sorting domain-containing protein, partial [Bacteroidota bacterium]
MQDINPGMADGEPGWFKEINGKIIFGADDGQIGEELWITDPASDSTQLLVDIHPGILPSQLSFTTRFKDHIYFSAADQSGAQLYRTDGTASGTTSLTIGTQEAPKPANFIIMDSILYFTADTRAAGRELWRTDGTQAGTYLVADINQERDGRGDGFVPGFGFDPRNMVVAGDSLLYFPATDEINTSTETTDELYVTNGTATQLVKDIYPGIEGSNPRHFFQMANGKVLFAANDGVHNIELWTLDPDSSTVSIERLQLNRSNLITEIFPNPSHDTFSIGVSLSQSEEVEFVIFDGTGTLCQTKSLGRLAAGQHNLRGDLTQFPAGVYLIRLRVGDQI